MPTRRGEFEARCQSDLHHGALAPPAAHMHHSPTREPVEVVHLLDTHAAPGVTQGSQKELAAVVMRTMGCLTSPTGHFVELMEK